MRHSLMCALVQNAHRAQELCEFLQLEQNSVKNLRPASLNASIGCVAIDPYAPLQEPKKKMGQTLSQYGQMPGRSES